MLRMGKSLERRCLCRKVEAEGYLHGKKVLGDEGEGVGRGCPFAELADGREEMGS
jgi:hypothetical protein